MLKAAASGAVRDPHARLSAGSCIFFAEQLWTERSPALPEAELPVFIWGGCSDCTHRMRRGMFEVFEPLSNLNLTKLHSSHFLRHQQFGAWAGRSSQTCGIALLCPSCYGNGTGANWECDSSEKCGAQHRLSTLLCKPTHSSVPSLQLLCHYHIAVWYSNFHSSVCLLEGRWAAGADQPFPSQLPSSLISIGAALCRMLDCYSYCWKSAGYGITGVGGKHATKLRKAGWYSVPPTWRERELATAFPFRAGPDLHFPKAGEVAKKGMGWPHCEQHSAPGSDTAVTVLWETFPAQDGSKHSPSCTIVCRNCNVNCTVQKLHPCFQLLGGKGAEPRASWHSYLVAVLLNTAVTV